MTMADQNGNSRNLPLFKVSDPMSNQQIDLDELFNDIYYLDQNEIPDPTPVEAHSSSEGNPSASMAPPISSNYEPLAEKKRSANEAGLTDNGNDGNDDTHHGGGADDSEFGNKDLTEQQKLERRERNREHAKRSRLRKKFLLESLQGQINELEDEVQGLKDAIKKEIPEKSDEIINSVCGHKDKYTPLPMPSGFGPVKTLMEPDFRLMSALSGSQQNFAISDPTLPDNPIVYCSQGFLDLTGYTLDQVLGKNCRFLQGPGTDQSAVQVISKGIAEGVDTSVCLLNYKADGTPFWNQFFVAALRDAQNNVVNYVGVQCEVSKAVVEKHMPQAVKK